MSSSTKLVLVRTMRATWKPTLLGLLATVSMLLLASVSIAGQPPPRVIGLSAQQGNQFERARGQVLITNFDFDDNNPCQLNRSMQHKR